MHICSRSCMQPTGSAATTFTHPMCLWCRCSILAWPHSHYCMVCCTAVHLMYNRDAAEKLRGERAALWGCIASLCGSLCKSLLHFPLSLMALIVCIEESAFDCWWCIVAPSARHLLTSKPHTSIPLCIYRDCHQAVLLACLFVPCNHANVGVGTSAFGPKPCQCNDAHPTAFCIPFFFCWRDLSIGWFIMTVLLHR